MLLLTCMDGGWVLWAPWAAGWWAGGGGSSRDPAGLGLGSNQPLIRPPPLRRPARTGSPCRRAAAARLHPEKALGVEIGDIHVVRFAITADSSSLHQLLWNAAHSFLGRRPACELAGCMQRLVRQRKLTSASPPLHTLLIAQSQRVWRRGGHRAPHRRQRHPPHRHAAQRAALQGRPPGRGCHLQRCAAAAACMLGVHCRAGGRADGRSVRGAGCPCRLMRALLPPAAC